MVISNYRLPEIDLDIEKILNDDDVAVSAALKIVSNYFESAQKRTRDIIKAYNELKSFTVSILKELHENREKLSQNNPGKSLVTTNEPGKTFIGKVVSEQSVIEKNVPGKSLIDKNVPGKTLIDENLLKNKTSTSSSYPKVANGKERRTSDKVQKEIEMIDLTSIFDYNRAENRLESRSREVSPELGERRQKSSKKHIVASSPNDLRQKVNEEYGNTSENQGIAGNEENRPPLDESGLNNSSNNDSMLRINESRPVAKMLFAKSCYYIERSKTPNGKMSRQSRLIFHPAETKRDIGSSDKIITKSNIFGHHDVDLFDEHYLTKKKMKDTEKPGQSKEQSETTIAKDPTKTESDKTAGGRIDKNESDEKPGKKIETCPLTPTASQIDETARSLFDDDDIDDFGVSQDLLNNCVPSPVLVDSPQEIERKDNVGGNKIVEAIASTSSATLFAQSEYSIDETFFAPAELMEFKSEAKKKIVKDIPAAGCSTIAKSNNIPENNRALKRKSEEEAIIDAENEYGDLGVHDVNWDAESSNDGWITSNGPIDNSFDMPPKKKTNSPQYAHKGKVERNKAKRSKLPGWDCRECERYYATMNLPEDELKKRINACSRHKSKYNQRYNTPAGFWNPDFPDMTDSSDCSQN